MSMIKAIYPNDPFPQSQHLTNAYQKIRLLGKGGCAEVWLVEDCKKRLWAMKQLKHSCVEEKRIAFQSEGHILKRLDHPAIPHLYHSFTNQFGDLIMVMEYMKGDSLMELPCISDIDLIRWGVQILEILCYLHEHDILYCDLKPQHLILHDGKLCLLDFGAAIDCFYHIPMARFGTRFYAAPEQLRKDPLDGRCDIYSFGKVLRTLYVYYNTQQSFSTMASFSLLQRLHDVIDCCLKENPDDRFQTTCELRSVFIKLLRHYRFYAFFKHQKR